MLIYLGTPGATVLSWPGWLWPVPWCMRGLALYLFLAAGFRVDMRRFLGLIPIGTAGGRAQTGSELLVVDGIFRHIRHPWYLAGLLLLWGRDLAARDLVTAVTLSVYLYLGSVLEERRLLAEYGESYRRYQREVPRFCPRIRLPWRR
jgi:protein-S-isoprenylcysteine O-methyltransferase Ste14